MIYTILLARFLGIMFVVVNLGILFNRKQFLAFANSLVNTPSSQVFASILPTALGSFLIVTHNQWTGGWPVVLVSVIGWIIFLVGLFRIFFPQTWVSAITKRKDTAFPIVMSCIWLIIGIVLLYLGFV